MSDTLLKLSELDLCFLILDLIVLKPPGVFLFVFFKLRPFLLDLLNLLSKSVHLIFAFFDLIIRKLLDDDVIHSSCSRFTTSTHSSRFLNQLTLKSHNSVADLTICNTSCEVNTITDESIFKPKIESIFEFFITNINQIVKTLRSLWSSEGFISLLLIRLSDFIQTDELALSNFMISQELNTSFTIIYIVNNNMI